MLFIQAPNQTGRSEYNILVTAVIDVKLAGAGQPPVRLRVKSTLKHDRINANAVSFSSATIC